MNNNNLAANVSVEWNYGSNHQAHICSRRLQVPNMSMMERMLHRRASRSPNMSNWFFDVRCSCWAALGLDTLVEQLWDNPPPPLRNTKLKLRSTVVICVLWKCRNSKVFKHSDETNHRIFRRCADNLSLWSYRCFSVPDKTAVLECSSFSSSVL